MLDKPFIKLFHTPNSGYVYDVGMNDILRIPENMYQHLMSVLKGQIELDRPNDKELLDMVLSLQELGYLSSNKPQKIQHPATEIVPLLLDRSIDKITLQLTQDCNFRCKYCIYSDEINQKQRSHAPKVMSLETAKKAILYYRDHAIDSNMYSVGFYGGEPLMQWDLLKEVVLYAERELDGKMLTFSLTTNASLITEYMAAFLEDHNVGIVVSLDGIKTVNDENRVFQNGTGSYDVVMKHIRMIKEKHPKLFQKMRISSVLDPKTDAQTFGRYPSELAELPISNYTVSIEENTELKTVIPRDLHLAMENEVFIAYLSDIGLISSSVSPYGFKQIENIHTSMNTIKPTNGIQSVMAPGGPCIPGKSRLFITVDGDLYPCERVNETDSYCIGSLDRGFDYEKAKQMLNIGSITETKCQNCWAMRNCTMCCKYFDYFSHNAAREKMTYCDAIQKSVYNTMRGIILFSETEKFYSIKR